MNKGNPQKLRLNKHTHVSSQCGSWLQIYIPSQAALIVKEAKKEGEAHHMLGMQALKTKRDAQYDCFAFNVKLQTSPMHINAKLCWIRPMALLV